MNLKEIYFSFYEIAKKIAVKNYVKQTAKSHLKQRNILTKEEKKQARSFWAPYKKIDLIYHAFYKEKTGEFHPEFLPKDMYFNEVDPYFNNREASWWLDHKCLYPRLLPNIPQADSILFRMGGLWFDSQWQMLTVEQAIEIVSNEPAVFIKAAARSYCGNGVQFISNDYGNITDMFATALTKQNGDVVVQRPIRQHATLSALHESSVNTLRILTLLSENGVKVCSTIVRMGVGGAKIDNAADTGLFCGVDKNGRLARFAYRMNGSRCETHPTSGVVFDGYQIEGYEKAKELVCKAAPLLPLFREVSWDVVIDEHGEPLVLETNMAKGSLHYHQLTNGPLFGEDTKKILDEVFGKK